jgi:hypothetical protein
VCCVLGLGKPGNLGRRVAQGDKLAAGQDGYRIIEIATPSPIANGANLFVEFSLEARRRPRRLDPLGLIARRAGHAGAPAGTRVLAFPRSVRMTFVDAAAVLATGPSFCGVQRVAVRLGEGDTIPEVNADK